MAQSLKSNVHLLGTLLGQAIADAEGKHALDDVEAIRQLAKSSREGDESAKTTLINTLHSLEGDALLLVARAFNQFLNLANVAEQYHTIALEGDKAVCDIDPLINTLRSLKEQGVDEKTLAKAACELNIELVLTAHPTEVTRRTLINKHVALAKALRELEIAALAGSDTSEITASMGRLISELWHTDEIRKVRPTPLDEAKWGFAVVENSLWQALSAFMRRYRRALNDEFGVTLSDHACPVRILSWMGGDRDGNPNVTSGVTQSVLNHSRWVACDLFLKDIDALTSALAMNKASDELKAVVDELMRANPNDESLRQNEPYRVVLKTLRDQISQSKQRLGDSIKAGSHYPVKGIVTQKAIFDVLTLCHRSLKDVGMHAIADGELQDTLWRLSAFGTALIQLDIRQDAERHSQVLSEVCQHLGYGDYATWDEQTKIDFLSQELSAKRPLIGPSFTPSDDSLEVLNTFKTIAANERQQFGIYIISMAQHASDVLAVKLLLKEANCPFDLPVAPLFETLDDLNRAPSVMKALTELGCYHDFCLQGQTVMIGYSDSAKDAGMMAAGWAQYQAMASLVALFDEKDIPLTLFHGRGGTVGRGGAPAAKALRSQPPGSLKGGLRVTEQGEMIRFKFGLPKVAENSLILYAAAVLENNITPPPKPNATWCQVMDTISDVSCNAYRNVVRETPEFVPYFRAATPETELGKLPLGSRPAKRKPTGGVESLRAIPWIFAWTQNRLMLPAWLGVAEGLTAANESFAPEVLADMQANWPFFRTRIEMLEMVFTKADPWLSEYYESLLVAPEHQALGKTLRQSLAEAKAKVLNISDNETLLANEPWVKESIGLRNPYTDPLNVLQAELMRRSRDDDSASYFVEQALMVTMAGIAAGMRNTG